jgi:hypothetical protein
MDPQNNRIFLNHIPAIFFRFLPSFRLEQPPMNISALLRTFERERQRRLKNFALFRELPISESRYLGLTDPAKNEQILRRDERALRK